MMEHGLMIDGTPLQTFAWNVTSRASRWQVGGRRGSNPTLPGVHGSLWTPGKPFEENTLVLNMWAIGANPDGSMPTGKSRREQCLENLDGLTRLFTAGGLRPLMQVYAITPALKGRFTQVEVVSAIDFSSMAGGTRAEFSVEMLAPWAFWFDMEETTQTIMVGGTGAADRQLAFSSFGGGTAPLVRAVYEVTGPAQSPMLTDGQTGQWVKLNANLAAGQVWRVDSASWTSTVAGANRIADTTHGEGATLLDLSPNAGGPLLRFQAAGGVTSATAVKITARKAYHLA